ncbi:hypothetical protein ACQP2U_42670 (plasmid) [Nocardia sp. CA-084685]|uniref:hypothetical protein n=1 Tax=Nocardia sp. CA-084685 TaxID=3239970 RepID=UPI003D992EA0
MGNFDESIDRERERVRRSDQAASSARAAEAEADRQAAALVREATEKFSGLAGGLRLVVVRPRKLFDRGTRIIGEGDNAGIYVAIDEMRCWALPSTRKYSRVVLTERGQLFTVGVTTRIRTRTHTDVVVSETDLRPTDIRHEFKNSSDMSGRADTYVAGMNHALAQAFVEYERAAERGTAGLAHAFSGRHENW